MSGRRTKIARAVLQQLNAQQRAGLDLSLPELADLIRMTERWTRRNLRKVRANVLANADTDQ